MIIQYIQHAFYSGDTDIDINSSGFLLLPPPHRPSSPAAPDGLVWWLPSQESWPGPSAQVYLSVNLPQVQSGRSLAALGTRRRNRGGNRWRWCDRFSSSLAPLDFLSLRRWEKVQQRAVTCVSLRWNTMYFNTHPHPSRWGLFLAPHHHNGCGVLSKLSHFHSLGQQAPGHPVPERQNGGSPLSPVCHTGEYGELHVNWPILHKALKICAFLKERGETTCSVTQHVVDDERAGQHNIILDTWGHLPSKVLALGKHNTCLVAYCFIALFLLLPHPKNCIPAGPSEMILLASPSPSTSGGGLVSFCGFTRRQVMRVGAAQVRGGMMTRRP